MSQSPNCDVKELYPISKMKILQNKGKNQRPSSEIGGTSKEVRDLRKRLSILPCRNRNVCVNSDNPHTLGTELKIRLAMHSPVLREISKNRNVVQVQSTWPKYRHVPIYDIDSEQDPELLCDIKVRVLCARSRTPL